MEAGKWVGVDCLVVQCGGVSCIDSVVGLERVWVRPRNLRFLPRLRRIFVKVALAVCWMLGENSLAFLFRMVHSLLLILQWIWFA